MSLHRPSQEMKDGIESKAKIRHVQHSICLYVSNLGRRSIQASPVEALKKQLLCLGQAHNR